MNLNHLAIFHAVAQAGSMTRGAERLDVSQPAGRDEGRWLPDRVTRNAEEGRGMVTALLDHPWAPLCLLYVGGWTITFFCARPRRRPPTGGGAPAGLTATEQARAGAEE